MCGPVGFNLQGWMEEWDDHVAQWIQTDGAHHLGSPALLAAYQAAAGGDFQGDALPEPYVGNPLGALNCVVLTHNPAGELQSQVQPNGALVTAVAGAGYAASATTWDLAVDPGHPQGGTKGWWLEKRARPLRRTLNYLAADPLVPGDLLGIDLVPWHSTKWHGIPVGDPTIEAHIMGRVLAPACHAARAAAVHFGGENGEPLAFAFGAPYRDFLDGRPDFERLYYVDQVRTQLGHQQPVTHGGIVAGEAWPLKAAGVPWVRFFALYRRRSDCVQGARLHVLVTPANQGNAWRETFDSIVRRLVAGDGP